MVTSLALPVRAEEVDFSLRYRCVQTDFCSLGNGEKAFGA